MKKLLSICLTALALAGCEDISGGGWIPSINPPAKATFGFDSLCTDTAGGAVLSGDIEYVDHGVLVKSKGKQPMAIHMDISALFGGVPIGTTCAQVDIDLWGELLESGQDGRIVAYCPQPSDGTDCGFALVVVTDTGNNGPSKGDTFSIALIGGAFNGYSNTGALEGGNITVGTP